MTPERWQQIDRVLEGVVARPEAERIAVLEQACGRDRALRQEVESLIRFRERADSFLEVPVVQAFAELLLEEADSMIGLFIGPYKVEAQLGFGGMGEVYLAEDTTLDRKVAIKFLPSYLEADELAKKRLIREAKAVAKLDRLRRPMPGACDLKRGAAHYKSSGDAHRRKQI